MPTIIITGATGLIGHNLVQTLLAESAHNQLVLPVRNVAEARAKIGETEQITYICHDFQHPRPLDYEGDVDYIIHGACPTSSAYIKEHPVETIDTIVNGTSTMLNVARQKSVKGMVFLSSLEVYGTIADDTILLTEDQQGFVDPLMPRNSYPVGKRMAETMCHAYAVEYGVPVRIARLTQTFGTGVDLRNDQRVFAQLARCTLASKDIVLQTEGKTRRMYLHTLDAVSAILCLMRMGEHGAAYNIANEQTYCSIREMAEFVRDHYNPAINIIYRPHSDTPYLPETYMRLSTKKIRSLGWQPKYGLDKMFDDMFH